MTADMVRMPGMGAASQDGRVALFSRIAGFAPGIALSGAIAAGASALASIPWFSAHGLSVLTLAIALGMLVGNVRPAGQSTGLGVGFAKQELLRLGITLYGLRLTFQAIAHIGIAGALIDAAVLTSTFALATVLGPRLFRLDHTTAMLIGAGSSICGAAAVMATEPVLKAKPAQVAVAVSTVVVFGTIATFSYPALYAAVNAHHALSPEAYGIYAGSTIHEVAQVVAAGRAVSPSAADTAVVAKMVRVMMLAPFLVALSAWTGRRDTTPTTRGRRGITIPWFAVGFLVMAGVSSLHFLPAPLVKSVLGVDSILLSISMAALGLTTSVSAMRSAGVRPLALAAILFAWLMFGGAAMNVLVKHALG